ncbi:glutamate--cysteine ligase regulatory subunit [Atheta coriaria]|uniref:glutamate--cysteine ligase regulatory subunit n=1 Tax=Dalotia coriaria TaxID=877792 RepID=UPI0031F36FFA
MEMTNEAANVMAPKIIRDDVKTVIVNTGNILSSNDITKNPGQNPAEELAEAVGLTVSTIDLGSINIDNGVAHYEQKGLLGDVANEEIENLKIGIKVFLEDDNSKFLQEAIDKAFAALNVSAVHNVIISLNNKGTGDEQVRKIKNIWSSVESYVKTSKIQQVGLSDVEESAFRRIYSDANIKPSIIQINLATCCVVPPSLQQFCKDNEVLLLTHSDPAEILPATAIADIFGAPFNLNWAVRFLVHIKCRGVLTTKGYILSLSK